MYNILLERILMPVGDKIFGKSLYSSLQKVRKEVLFNEREIKNLQKVRLMETLAYAKKHSPYYNKVIPSAQAMDAGEILRNTPLLTKEIIRARGKDLLTADVETLHKLNSSGSTGIQTEVYVSNDELSMDRAIQIMWWEWAGYKLGMPIVQTGLANKRSFEKRLKDIFFRTKYVYAFALTRKDIERISKWSRFKNPFLAGYASSLYVMAKLSQDTNLSFLSAVSWGDKLFSNYKKEIKRVLGCKTYETYGSGEGLKIAAQKDLDYMYIMSPYIWLEILDNDDNEVKEGEIGNVVITSLVNKSMPLIRYKLGDLAIKLPKSEYPKKMDLSLPLIQKVIGRDTDLIHTPGGKKLIVHSFTGIFEYYPEIIQFCVEQKELTGIKILYIPSEYFLPEILNQIKSKLDKLIQETFDIVFEEVNEIPNTRSGKPQIIISDFKF